LSAFQQHPLFCALYRCAETKPTALQTRRYIAYSSTDSQSHSLQLYRFAVTYPTALQISRYIVYRSTDSQSNSLQPYRFAGA
jgi:hypothetical protein